ncbi:MAG TPA: sensor domain-containing diguanylate cyclase [Acholeplasmataceae bacterium]|nr:sensor domain-containing diguanylate cyclase [Acholeplasmataceae bacterium]
MKSLEQLKLMFDHFHEAIYIVDINREILFFNIMASEISGFSQKEMTGLFCYENKLNHVDDFGNHLCFEGCPLVESITKDMVTDHFVYLHHKKGHRIRVHVRAIPYKENGEIVGAIEVFTDETQKNLMQQELEIQKNIALLDPLTGLFNRRFLSDSFPKVLSASENPGTLGILMIDIDHFKRVNDQYGHALGDEVLVYVSNTIKYNLRANDYVVRMGGEEILVLLSNIDSESLVSISEKMRTLVEASEIKNQDSNISVTVTIGATLHYKNEVLMESVDRADDALYEGKANGRNQVVVH